MTRSWTDLVTRARTRLLDEPSSSPRKPTVRAVVREAEPLVGGPDFEATAAALDADLGGMGALDPLLADTAVTEVMVNGGGDVWIERGGALHRVRSGVRDDEVMRLIERVVAPLGRHVDRLHPIVDGRLPDGSRVHAVVPPLAVDGPALSIRRFAPTRVALDQLCGAEVARLLSNAVRARSNILVSGGSSAGKTTLLNALAAEIDAGERIITVEDAAELRLCSSHVVRLESRPPNAEGVGEVGVRDLVRSALRMRPDRIIVGEIRGGEAVDMLQAMNTGHDGSLSTCHANSPEDALRRVETLVLMGDLELPLPAVREQVASAIDLVVQMARRADGTRTVVQVGEVERHPDVARSAPVRVLATRDTVVDSATRPARWAVTP